MSFQLLNHGGRTISSVSVGEVGADLSDPPRLDGQSTNYTTYSVKNVNIRINTSQIIVDVTFDDAPIHFTSPVKISCIESSSDIHPQPLEGTVTHVDYDNGYVYGYYNMSAIYHNLICVPPVPLDSSCTMEYIAPLAYGYLYKFVAVPNGSWAPFMSTDYIASIYPYIGSSFSSITLQPVIPSITAEAPITPPTGGTISSPLNSICATTQVTIRNINGGIPVIASDKGNLVPILGNPAASPYDMTYLLVANMTTDTSSKVYTIGSHGSTNLSDIPIGYTLNTTLQSRWFIAEPPTNPVAIGYNGASSTQFSINVTKKFSPEFVSSTVFHNQPSKMSIPHNYPFSFGTGNLTSYAHDVTYFLPAYVKPIISTTEGSITINAATVSKVFKYSITSSESTGTLLNRSCIIEHGEQNSRKFSTFKSTIYIDLFDESAETKMVIVSDFAGNVHGYTPLVTFLENSYETIPDYYPIFEFDQIKEISHANPSQTIDITSGSVSTFSFSMDLKISPNYSIVWYPQLRIINPLYQIEPIVGKPYFDLGSKKLTYTFLVFVPYGTMPGPLQYKLVTNAIDNKVVDLSFPTMTINVVSSHGVKALHDPIAISWYRDPYVNPEAPDNQEELELLFTIPNFVSHQKALFQFATVYIESTLNPYTFQVTADLSNLNDTGSYLAGGFQSLCQVNTLTIVRVEVLGKNKITNTYDYYQGSYPASPLVSIPDPIVNTCYTTDTQPADSIPPQLTSFAISEIIPSRRFHANITVTDDIAGIQNLDNTIHLYLMSSDPGLFGVKFKDTGSDPYLAFYEVLFDIPYGFANGTLLLSLYGFMDNRYNMNGYSTTKLNALGYTSTVNSIFVTKPVIYSHSPISVAGGKITVFGDALGTYPADSPNVFGICDFRDGNPLTIMRLTEDTYYQLQMIFSIPAFSAQYCYFMLSIDSVLTNEILVSPTGWNISFPCPAPSCGGHGTCTATGCVCSTGWSGSNCTSQTIINVKPVVDTVEPMTTIPVPSSNASVMLSTSSVSIEYISELDAAGVPVQGRHFPLTPSSWVYTNATTDTDKSLSYRYIATLPNNATINVTLDWIDEATDIEFAGQTIKMSASTVKYTIVLRDYPFANRLNTLKVSFAAQIETDNELSCSSNEMGYLNMMASNDIGWMQLRVDNTSLYSRFIKSGIVDGRVTRLSNTIDTYTKNISSLSSGHVGIIVPYFASNAVIDPDFQVLINTEDADPTKTVCINGKPVTISTKKDKLLSTGAMIGIIVGCVAAAALIGLGIFMYAKHKHMIRHKVRTIKLKTQSSTKSMA
eukprot:gene4104-4791_t